MSAPSKPTESHLTTENELLETKTDWTIRNFFFYPCKQDDEKSSIKSPPVLIERDDVKLEWHILVFPFDIDEESPASKDPSNRYVGVYLYLDKGPLHAVKAFTSFSISLIGQEKQTVIERHMTDSFPIKSNDQGVGWATFIKRSQLSARSEELVPGGHLTFRCHIRATIEYYQITGLSESQVAKIVSNYWNQGAARILEEMYREQLYTDFVVKTKDREIKCHKSILASRCPFFKAMFRHDFEENRSNVLDLSESLNYEEVADLMNFIYTKKTTKLDKTCFKLFCCADSYGMDDLKRLCEVELIKKLNKDSAFELLSFAEKNGAKYLKKSAAKCLFEIPIEEKI